MYDRSLVHALPHPKLVRDRLGDALREVELLRRLLRVAERAEEYREYDRSRQARHDTAEVHHAD